MSEAPKLRFRAGDIGFLGVMLCTVGFFIIHLESLTKWISSDGAGELALGGGLSVWPVIFFRIFIIYVCIWLTWRVRIQLLSNIKMIAMKFGAKDVVQLLSAPITWGQLFDFSQASNHAEKLIGIFFRDGRNFNHWRDYIGVDRYYGRLQVSLFMSLFFSVVSILCVWFLDDPPLIRGNVPYYLYWASLFFQVFFVSLITIYLLDVTCFNVAFVEDFLLGGQSPWPNEVRSAFLSQMRRSTLSDISVTLEKDNLDRDEIINAGKESLSLLDKLIDVVFIERRTECLLPLIYSPLFVIALTIIGRGSFVSPSPLGNVGLFGEGLGLVAIVGCALRLTSMAEKARENLLEELGNQLVRSGQVEDGPLINGGSGQKGPRQFEWSSQQLRDLIAWVRDMHAGAFSPPLEQPFVRGLLLPVGGFVWNYFNEATWLPTVFS